MTEQLISIQAIIDADDLPCFVLDRELRYTFFFTLPGKSAPPA